MMKGVESSDLSRRYGGKWFKISTAGPKRLFVSPAGRGRDRATRGVAGAACHGANMGRAITRIF